MFSASDRRALRLTFDVTHIPPRIPPKTMPELTRPAARIRQGNLIIYATSLQVRDLREPNFYKIDTLDADEGTGYQRLLNETRAKRLADYLLDGHKALEAFLPTSIFLATDKLVPFDEKSNTVRIDPDKIGAFNVVDGQHRIRGLAGC
jgi:DGQHR domain-containing protein